MVRIFFLFEVVAIVKTVLRFPSFKLIFSFNFFKKIIHYEIRSQVIGVSFKISFMAVFPITISSYFAYIPYAGAVYIISSAVIIEPLSILFLHTLFF